MTKDNERPTPVNDNRFSCVPDAVGRTVISDRLDAALEELSSIGAADAAIIDALFSAMFDLAYRAHQDASDGARDGDRDGRRALGRYNQLSRLSGELEGLMALVWRDWMDRLSQA